MFTLDTLDTEAEAAEWLQAWNSVSSPGYYDWRRKVSLTNLEIANVHDAWRSTAETSDDPTAPVNLRLDQLDGGTPLLCLLTAKVAVESLFEHAHYYWLRGRPFDNGFAYRAMNAIYQRYLIMTTITRGDPRKSAEPLSRITLDPEYGYFDYGSKPPEFKEKDRRILAVSSLAVANPDLEFWDRHFDRDQLLADPRLKTAMADGRAILDAVHEGTPYDQEKGFAHEVVHWRT